MTADAKSTFVLATTLDSGQTWQKSIVEPASPYLSSIQQICAGASYIFFSDAMNGWAELQRASSSNFKDGILLATRDGGKSWIELPQPPTVDAMTWISPDVGWIAGGLLQGDLFATRDGGLTWQKQTPPTPSITTDKVGQASPPKFTDAQHGIFVVTFHNLKVNVGNSLVAVYRTSDAGKTWITSELQEVSFIGGRATVSQDGIPIWGRFAKGKVQTTILSNTNSAQVTSISLPRSFYVVSESFADANSGFLLVQGSACEAPNTCDGVWRLLATADAGRSMTDVTPPDAYNNALHASSLGIVTATARPDALTVPPHNTTVRGFDIASAPTLSSMAAAKPNYAVVGIYAGGGNRSDKTQANLNSSWRFFANCMGYSFAPIWVGPQAQGTSCSSCSVIPYTGSNATDEYNAYQSGASEAANAANTLKNTYGFTDGAIVYYDMEGYNGSVNNSSALVQNFIGGWVDRLNQNNLLSGAYFSVSNWNDFDQQSVPPADVYVADYNSNPSIYGLTYRNESMPDGVWTGDQRIHQYADTNSISGIGTVDSLSVDAATVVYNDTVLSQGCPGRNAPPMVSCNNGTSLAF